MNTVILVQTKSNYGSEAIYVVSEHKQAIGNLTGKKTIDARDIQALKELGFTIQEQPKETKTY